MCSYLEDRALRKCPVDIFSDGPACRVDWIRFGIPIHQEVSRPRVALALAVAQVIVVNRT